MKLPKEEKEQIIESVQRYAEEEWNQPIGRLGAEQWVDFMLKELGPYVYNEALQDARAVLLERMQSLEDELYTLEKPLTTRRGKDR